MPFAQVVADALELVVVAQVVVAFVRHNSCDRHSLSQSDIFIVHLVHGPVVL